MTQVKNRSFPQHAFDIKYGSCYDEWTRFK